MADAPTEPKSLYPTPGPTPEKLEAAREFIEGLGFSENPGEPFETSRGIVLKATSVPPHLIADVELAFPEPPVPMVDVERSGINLVEPNPDDPQYLKAKRDWQFQVESARQRALFAMGLEVVEIPIGEQGPEDAWDKELAELPIAIPEPGAGGRKLAWLIYYVLANSKDIGDATRRCVRMVGISEGDVAYMATMFQGDEAGAPAQS